MSEFRLTVTPRSDLLATAAPSSGSSIRTAGAEPATQSVVALQSVPGRQPSLQSMPPARTPSLQSTPPRTPALQSVTGPTGPVDIERAPSLWHEITL
jgi:hypothetical protein